MILKPNIEISDFNYHLPEERIAQSPLAQRDQSRLLVLKDGIVSEDHFTNIDSHLPEGSFMIFNDTKVLKARMIFRKTTGAEIEIFCLEPSPGEGDPEVSLHRTGSTRWQCLIGNLKRWKEGKVNKTILLDGDQVEITAEKIAPLEDGCFIVEFRWKPDTFQFSQILSHAGLVPLPPYIHRAVEESDTTKYQTIYAEHDGSVAAPTAGLHFTTEVFQKIEAKNISKDRVTLHVGLGTFRPVSATQIADHIMHEERVSVKLSTIFSLIENERNPIIAVGTTSVRTLESLYWMGVKLLVDGMNSPPIVNQWDPYNEKYNIGIPNMEALNKVVSTMNIKGFDRFIGQTQLLIAPGYDFKIVQGMVTNFHLPQSTLLLLIAALIGDDWKKVYDHALNHGFRFLSYGDACLLMKRNY